MASRIFSQEEISHLVGGILTKAADSMIDKVAPPLLADENTLALALGEDEIENLGKTKAKMCACSSWCKFGAYFNH